MLQTYLGLKNTHSSKSWTFKPLTVSWKMQWINKAKGMSEDFSSWKCIQLYRISLWKHTVVFQKGKRGLELRGSEIFSILITSNATSLNLTPSHCTLTVFRASETHVHCKVMVGAFGTVNSRWTIIHYSDLKTYTKCSFHSSLITGEDGLAAEQQCLRFLLKNTWAEWALIDMGAWMCVLQ